MLNIVALMGRLTHTPELKTTQNGTSVCSFSIAVDRTYTPKGEERKADFIDIVAWRQTSLLYAISTSRRKVTPQKQKSLTAPRRRRRASRRVLQMILQRSQTMTIFRSDLPAVLSGYTGVRKEVKTHGYRKKILLAKAQRQLYAV